MPFDPLEFLTTAKNLSNGNTESQFRTSISRSYYSVFLLIRDKIETKYGKFQLKRHGEIHQKVNDKLLELRLFKIASKLDGLRKNRRDADYFLSLTIGQNDAENSWKLANNIYQLIQASL
ncbi:MAG: HEPN domain-containing protein [Thaumarchaeota archaeon]|nr:HEPN domain-containing protein [Nitrososphaerota archaeon]MDE1841090.1 HEPN domain-containing protein [Nitrososphaerota archaeon]